MHKSFGTNKVLKGIDLKVQAVDVIAITGKSGSGKSTLLRCISVLETFQAGSMRVDGRPLLNHNGAATRELRQHVGMVFQSFNLFPHLTVGKNIMLAPGLVKQKDGAANEALACKLAHRVVFMHQGLVHEIGAPEVLIATPQTQELKQFLSALHD
jgi:polar amino acid transport system ATP-binding protein